MDIYLFNRPEWDRLYNCSLYAVDAIPLAQRQHARLGWLAIGIFFLMEV
jgi:hypothetical protein